MNEYMRRCIEIDNDLRKEAAWELYSALTDLLAALKSKDRESFKEDLEQAVDKAERAISKADGREY